MATATVLQRDQCQVVQAGSVYTLDGFDDQCGGPHRAPLVGTATSNPDGSIGFGLHIVSVPGGRPVSVDARISLASLGGTWSDSVGNSGALAFNAATGGTPRPAPVLAGSGDITAVTAGAGLSGGDGALDASARADHEHLAGGVGIGAGALAVSTGASNIAVGTSALQASTSGIRNVAVGHQALDAHTTGSVNIALCASTLGANTTGGDNVAVGDSALAVNVAGSANVAVGSTALNNATGAGNTALGAFAGTGTCASDARFKREVTPFPPMLDRVVRLQPVHYFWRADQSPDRGFGRERTHGLVAQDVAEALPELVHEQPDGFKAVDYSQLPLVLLQALRELEAANRVLRDRVAALESALPGLARQTPR